MSFVRSACLCLLSWDRRDARTRQCITTVQRGKKFTGGETIDLQSLRETICVVEGDRVGVTRLIQAVCGEGDAWYLEIPRPRTH